MLPEKIQSTVFVVDIVPIGPDDVRSDFPIRNPSHRLRIREITTVIGTDCLTGKNLGLCALVQSKETELEYEVIPGSGPITINDHAIEFNEAGIRVWSKAEGLAVRAAEAGQRPCGTVSHGIMQVLLSLMDSLNEQFEGSDDGTLRFEYLLNEAPGGVHVLNAMATCLEGDLGDGRTADDIRASVATVDSLNTRIFDFHTHARFYHSGGRPINVSTDLPGDAHVLTPPTEEGLLSIKVTDLANSGRLQPIVWYPFVGKEAFSFGAITSGASLRLYGRLGSTTEGNRVTAASHWNVNADETRVLAFRQDFTTQKDESDPPVITFEKIAEFDAGALFPGDVDTKVNSAPILLSTKPVPFYIGAMPLKDPKMLSVKDVAGGKPILETTDGSAVTFSFMNGQLDVPIVFDPVTNCTGC